MQMNKALWAFYLNSGIREIIPIYPLYAIMFGENGVSPFFLSILFVIWCITGIVVEVPSGALADRFSRKWLIVASGVFKAAAFLTWFLQPHFWGFALGFILWGTGSSLRSGAWEALLYDLLKRQGAESIFSRHYGRMSAFATTGVMFGEIAGGVLIMSGYDAVLLVSMCVPLIASLFFVFWVDDVRGEPEDDEEEEDYFTLLKAGVHEAVTSPPIRYIFLVTMFLIVSYDIYDEFVEPYVFETGFSHSMVAFLASGIVLAAALGEFFAERFEKSSMNGLFGLMVLANLLLMGAFFMTAYAVPALIAAYCLVFAMARVQLMARLQDHIEGAARATVTSTLGLGENVGAIAWFLMFGAIAETSMGTASASMAVICIGLVAIFLYVAPRLGVRLKEM